MSDNMKIDYFETPSDGYMIPCKMFSKSGECNSVIVAAHGFGGDKESSAISLLAECMPCDRRVIAFDFPAHGKGADDKYLSVENCINDLIRVCRYAENTFEGADILIFATSFGGYIYLLAEEMLRNIVKGAVLRAPAVEMAKTLSEKIIDISVSEFCEKGSTVLGFERKFIVRYDFLSELVKNDALSVCPKTPILMVLAQNDELCDHTSQVHFAKANSEYVNYVDIEGAGHRFKGKGELEAAISAANLFFEQL